MTCNWSACGLQMNKESIVRHVTEIHLEYRFDCGTCGYTYSHRDELNRHQEKHFSDNHA
ncbi:hypothetical protein ID866_6150 [Astraeus odoratus]|nr:hypothetical protein ID866_6150 [Astraeus odoratus]